MKQSLSICSPPCNLPHTAWSRRHAVCLWRVACCPPTVNWVAEQPADFSSLSTGGGEQPALPTSASTPFFITRPLHHSASLPLSPLTWFPFLLSSLHPFLPSFPRSPIHTPAAISSTISSRFVFSHSPPSDQVERAPWYNGAVATCLHIIAA